MQDVAHEAGVSLGTLYRCFAGKWELYRAIHSLRGEELLARGQVTSCCCTIGEDHRLESVEIPEGIRRKLQVD